MPEDAKDVERALWQDRFYLDVEGLNGRGDRGNHGDRGERAERDRQLKAAWLVVINDIPALHLRLFEKPRYRDGRFLKWSLVHDKVDRPLANTVHYDVRPPALVIPKLMYVCSEAVGRWKVHAARSPIQKWRHRQQIATTQY